MAFSLQKRSVRDITIHKKNVTGVRENRRAGTAHLLSWCACAPLFLPQTCLDMPPQPPPLSPVLLSVTALQCHPSLPVTCLRPVDDSSCDKQIGCQLCNLPKTKILHLAPTGIQSHDLSCIWYMLKGELQVLLMRTSNMYKKGAIKW
jgi:hypothetical protein